MTDYLNPHRIGANYPVVNRAGEIQTGRIDIPPGFDSDRATLHCHTPGEEDVVIEAEKEGLAVLRDEDGEIVGFWKEESK